MTFPVISGEERGKLLAPPTGRVRAVIDSDTFNEVDDQFAIAYALRSPESLDIQAIYAAPFSNWAGGMVPEATGPEIGMEMSYKEILHILELMEEDMAGRVFRGSTQYLPGSYEPVESEAARDLVKKAMESDEPLYVLALGAITNVASAILMEPEIIKKIVVVWLGGQPQTSPYTIEFNLSQDMHASRLMFDSGVPLVHIPCMGVASNLTTTPTELRAFLSGNPAATYLTEIVCAECEKEHKPAKGLRFMKDAYLKGFDDYSDQIVDSFTTSAWAPSRIIWDISVIAYMINPNWCPSMTVPSPLLQPDMTWKPGSGRHMIRSCNYVYRDPVFGDLFAKLGSSAK